MSAIQMTIRLPQAGRRYRAALLPGPGLLSRLKQQGNGGTEQPSLLSEDAQLLTGGAVAPTQLWLTPKPTFLSEIFEDLVDGQPVAF